MIYAPRLKHDMGLPLSCLSNLRCAVYYEQHLNFAAIGQTQPEFPGGFTSNSSLQGTLELHTA